MTQTDLLAEHYAAIKRLREEVDHALESESAYSWMWAYVRKLQELENDLRFGKVLQGGASS
jgi:hypothetical protein